MFPYNFAVLCALLGMSIASDSCTDAGSGPFLGSCPTGTQHVLAPNGDDVCCPDNNVVPASPTNAGNSSKSDCVDLLNPTTGVSDCSARASLCNDSVYYDIMTIQCPKTCGRCSGGCADKINPKTGQSDCPQRKSYCNNATYKSLMKEECPQTCGFC